MTTPLDLSSLYTLYMEISDPTEYKFSRKVGGWTRWEELSKLPEVKKEVDKWRRELDAKIRSESLFKIMAAADGDTRDALAANKYLLEASWSKDKVGRPSKEAIQIEAKKAADRTKEMEDDIKRMLPLLNNNKN